MSNRNHSGAFPVDLPEWFIKLFTEPGNVVLDPFIGSGTTALAAINLDRNFIGIDILEKNCEITKKAVEGLSKRVRLL